ncbi:hypothetical protein RB195_023744 [Necator americanus]|uniref:Uncharacterized protein n=1 Tax=Necator americanus TaxID=51031 RepID=A0ABR1EKH9_NECAM
MDDLRYVFRYINDLCIIISAVRNEQVFSNPTHRIRVTRVTSKDGWLLYLTYAAREAIIMNSPSTQSHLFMKKTTIFNLCVVQTKICDIQQKTERRECRFSQLTST